MSLTSRDCPAESLGLDTAPYYLVLVVLLLASLSSRSDVGHGYYNLFLCLVFLHFSLTMFSINILQLLSFVVVLYSLSLTLQISLLMHAFHCMFGLLCLLFPSNFWLSDHFAIFFTSHAFHMMTYNIYIRT